jgi:hypothetical protein
VRLSDTNKLYKKLAPLQAATLAFEANVRRDTAEMLAITESQPRQYFSGTSTEYRHRFMNLTTLSLFYAGIYWKSRAVLMHRLSEYDEPAVIRIAATLGSMELALVKACEQLGVNVESIKKLGEIPKEDYFSEYENEALTDQYIELFVGYVVEV